MPQNYDVTIDTSALERRMEQVAFHAKRLGAEEARARMFGAGLNEGDWFVVYEVVSPGKMLARTTQAFDAMIDRLAAD